MGGTESSKRGIFNSSAIILRNPQSCRKSMPKSATHERPLRRTDIEFSSRDPVNKICLLSGLGRQKNQTEQLKSIFEVELAAALTATAAGCVLSTQIRQWVHE